MTDNIPQGLDGRLLESIVAWKNARYSEDLSRNIRRGLHYLVNHHRGVSGRAPVGYAKERVQVGTRRDGSPHIISRLVPDPIAVPKVRLAFEMRANGATLREIHARTHLFDWVVVYGRLLSKRLYLGEYVYGDQVIVDFCEPLIDVATFEAAQLVNREPAPPRDADTIDGRGSR